MVIMQMYGMKFDVGTVRKEWLRNYQWRRRKESFYKEKIESMIRSGLTQMKSSTDLLQGRKNPKNLNTRKKQMMVMG